MQPVKEALITFLLAVECFVLSFLGLLTAPFWIYFYHRDYYKHHPADCPGDKPVKKLMEGLWIAFFKLIFSGILLLTSPLWVLPNAIMQDIRRSDSR